MRYAVVIIVALASFWNLTIEAASAQQQTLFCEDAVSEGVLNLAPLPPEVVTALMNTAEGKDTRRSTSVEGKTLDPSTLFKGTKVHITDSHDVFFIVMGSYPMSGADNTWFWIVRQSGKRATILLFTGATCLDIRQYRTLGYRDIETDWASAAIRSTRVYRYNGRTYKLHSEKSQPNN